MIIITTSFNKYYYNCNYLLHRLGAPSYVNNVGFKAWFENGKRHREGGPAIEYHDGFVRYYLNGIFYEEKEYWQIIKFKGYL